MNTTPFALGVSGHQQLGDEATVHFLTHHFRRLLRDYQQQYQQLVLYSALAKGADQLFVQLALEQGVAVELVLPCAEYASLFTQEHEREDYTRLLGLGHRQHLLPYEHCSEEAFLAAGQWIVDRSDLLVLAWNGLPAQGKGGTADVASYARLRGRPWVHLNTRTHTSTTYSRSPSEHGIVSGVSPKQTDAIRKHVVYQGNTLTVQQYHVRMPDGSELVRDVVERPESVVIVPTGQQGMVLLAEEYDFGAGVWQLGLPGGKVEHAARASLQEQAHKELRQEMGYRAGQIEKLLDFYSHPGYISHRVHAFVARDLEWDPLDAEVHEEIKVRTYTLKEALAETCIDNRCDPEAALVLWVYARKVLRLQ